MGIGVGCGCGCVVEGEKGEVEGVCKGWGCG